MVPVPSRHLLKATTAPLLLLFAVACWERQDHELLPPVIPYYTLSGHTLDMDDSTRYLPFTPITLTAVQMLYDVTFPPLEFLSDSSGYYQIDSVFPGNYLITAEREGYQILEDKLTIGHQDTIRDLALPKPLLHYYRVRFGSASLAWVQGFLWVKGRHFVICRISDDGLRVDVFRYYPVPVEGSSGMDYHDGKLFVYSPPRVHIVSPLDASLQRSWLADEPFTSLTNIGSHYWTAQANYLQYRGSALDSVLYQYELPVVRIDYLTERGQHIWAYDTKRALIIVLSTDGRIIATFRPIDEETGAFIPIRDLDFNSFWTDQLWASSYRYLYMFMITDDLLDLE